MAHIMVADREGAIVQLLETSLARVGHRVSCVADAADAEAAVRHSSPDLVLLDWPHGDGSSLSVVRRWRVQPATRDLLVIMLTSRREERDKIAGLDAGADDYITKPFPVHELLARIRAVFRRWLGHEGTAPLQVGPLRLNSDTRRLYAHGDQVDIGATDFRILESLMRGAGRVQSRAMLVERVWGDAAAIETRTIDVHIKRLRDALAPVGCAAMIETSRGLGYRLSEQTSSSGGSVARRRERARLQLPAAA